MQIYSLRIKSYKSWCIDDKDYDDKTRSRYKKLKYYWQLRSEGCSEHTALEVIEVGRSTLYRWQQAYQRNGLQGLVAHSTAPQRTRCPQWSKHVEQQVLHLRRQFPLWGKRTLTTVLKRERGVRVSESTVGRILKKLMAQGKIKAVRFYYGEVKKKRVRVFKGHAKRWKKGMKAKRPGELMQMDHMTVPVWPGMSVKHFEATCPVSRITVSQAYRNASSRTAKQFLIYVQKQLPFPLKSIQVDGGSEFRKDFEVACEALGIALIVLPPRSPELNGCVERCHRTFRYECYHLYDGMFELNALRQALKHYVDLYNTFRPHQSLNQLTPMAYFQRNFAEAQKSHMY